MLGPPLRLAALSGELSAECSWATDWPALEAAREPLYRRSEDIPKSFRDRSSPAAASGRPGASELWSPGRLQFKK